MVWNLVRFVLYIESIDLYIWGVKILLRKDFYDMILNIVFFKYK